MQKVRDTMDDDHISRSLEKSKEGKAAAAEGGHIATHTHGKMIISSREKSGSLAMDDEGKPLKDPQGRSGFATGNVQNAMCKQKSPEESAEQIHFDATRYKPIFDGLLNNLAAFAKAAFGVKGGDVHAHPAPVKGIPRMLEKLKGKYNDIGKEGCEEVRFYVWRERLLRRGGGRARGGRCTSNISLRRLRSLSHRVCVRLYHESAFCSVTLIISFSITPPLQTSR